MGKATINEMEINGITYVPKDSVANVKAESLDGMEYAIIRTNSAGVHAGYIEKEDGKLVTLKKSRRLWYWSGASTLSQLAVDGTSNADDCKFPCEVETIRITEAIEVIPCTEKARKSIEGVKIWKQ